MAESNRRIAGFGYIRSLACIAVIFIHAIYCTIGLFGEGLSVAQKSLLWSVQNNMMWGVPCFLMVSGSLLLRKDRSVSYDKLFSKYIWRMVKAILVFGCIYTVLEFITSRGKGGILELLHGFYEVFAGKSWSHMWYLYCMVGIYLLLPFYKKIADGSRKSEIKYLLIVYVIFLSLLPILKGFNVDCGFYIHVSSIYPFWFFLGYYMTQWGKKNSLFFGISAIVSTVLLILLTCARQIYGLEMLDTLFTYSSILVIVQGMSIFALLYHLELKETNPVHKILTVIDSHSFGIYMIHLIFIRGLYKLLKFNPMEHGGMFAIIGIVAGCVIISAALDTLLKRIPFFSKIL